MVRNLLLMIFIFWNFQLIAQCKYENKSFQSGEKVSYDVYYKIGFLWFDAAYVEFEVSDTIANSNKAFLFNSFGQTKPSYDWIYKVRDYYKSVAQINTLNPLYFSRKTSEGSYMVNNNYRFNYTDSVIYSSISNSKKAHYNDTLKINGCELDVLTAIYACRSIDIEKLQINDTIPLKMLIDNEFYYLHLRYLGKENTILEDNSEFQCRKFSILLVEGTIFSGGEDLFVWISDDKARVPVRVEAKILVGSIIAQLNTVIGNKWALNSRVKNKPTE